MLPVVAFFLAVVDVDRVALNGVFHVETFTMPQFFAETDESAALLEHDEAL